MNPKDADKPQNASINVSYVAEKISKSNAYLGVVAGLFIFFIALFFSWTQIRSGVAASDSGSSSGWSEAGYIAAFPLLLVLYFVVQNKSLSVKLAMISGIASISLLLIDNVMNRTTWVGNQYMGVISEMAGKDVGSELGIGFWLGLCAILTVSACGLSWAVHTNNAEV